MESCTALAATFAECGDDLDRIPAEFTKARAPDAHAVQDLELLQVQVSHPIDLIILSNFPCPPQSGRQLLSLTGLMNRASTWPVLPYMPC